MSKFRNIIINCQRKYSQYRNRRRLKFKDFSIISNNCWAGSAVYQPFGLKYSSPTIGLGFVDEDYIKFLKNLKYYLSLTPVFIDPIDSPVYYLRKMRTKMAIDYPVALLDDITIWFTHYKTEEEALKKWEKRKCRINFDRLLVKWSMRHEDNIIVLKEFLALPYNNKIAFVSSKVVGDNPEVIIVPELEELNKTGGDETPSTLRHFNLTALLNSLKTD